MKRKINKEYNIKEKSDKFNFMIIKSKLKIEIISIVAKLYTKI